MVSDVTHVDRLRRLSDEFFRGHSGSVLDVEVQTTTAEPGSSDLTLLASVTVEFDNSGIFGDAGADAYDDVHLRYRVLRQAWWEALASAGGDGPSAPMRPHLFPLASPRAAVGPALAGGAAAEPGAITIVRLDELPGTAYLDRMRAEYGVEYGIRNSAGKVFDLDEALLLAVKSAAVVLGEVDTFVDLGSGTGSASAMMIRQCRTRRVLANDFSDASGRHLRQYLRQLGSTHGTRVEVVTGDCRDVSFRSPLTVLAISVAFGMQPSLLARKGQEIKDALGLEGVMVAASSMVGMPFYQSLIDGRDRRLDRWPWYRPSMNLSSLFECVEQVRVRNLLVTVASQASDRVDAITRQMARAGGVRMA